MKPVRWCKTVVVLKCYRRGFGSRLGASAEDWELIFHASTRGNKPSVYPSAGPATVKLYFPHDTYFVSMRLDERCHVYFAFCHDFPSWKPQRSGRELGETHRCLGVAPAGFQWSHKPTRRLQRGCTEQKTANEPISASSQIVNMATLGYQEDQVSSPFISFILGSSLRIV